MISEVVGSQLSVFEKCRQEGERLYGLPLKNLRPTELVKAYIYVLGVYGEGPRIREIEDVLDKHGAKEYQELEERYISLQKEHDDLEYDFDRLELER